MQRAELVLKLKPLLEEKAKANQVVRKGDQPAKATLQNSVKLSPVHTQAELAREAGCSHMTIHKVEKIVTKGIPELQEAARTGVVFAPANYFQKSIPSRHNSD